MTAKLMRFPRVKADGQGFYHCVSRVVDGCFIFQMSGRGSVEAERFIKLMRHLEAFSGVHVLTYVLMSTRSGPACVMIPRITVTAVTPRLSPRVLFLPVKVSEPSWASSKRSPGRNSVASIANTSL